jgi:hypothetical protein
VCEHRRTQSEKIGNGEECGGSFKETDEPPVCMFGEALLSLEVVRTYLFSYQINIASLRRTEDLERERQLLPVLHLKREHSSYLTPNQQTRCLPLIISKSNIPFMYACN